jgi:hypothetical protein
LHRSLQVGFSISAASRKVSLRQYEIRRHWYSFVRSDSIFLDILCIIAGDGLIIAGSKYYFRLMLHYLASHPLGIDISIHIWWISDKLTFGKHLIFRIANLFRFDSTICIILIGSWVIGLPLESILRKDEVVIDHIVSCNFCDCFSLGFEVVIVVRGAVVDWTFLDGEDVVLYCLRVGLPARDDASIVLYE